MIYLFADFLLKNIGNTKEDRVKSRYHNLQLGRFTYLLKTEIKTFDLVKIIASAFLDRLHEYQIE